MAEYANRATKELVMSIAAWVTWATRMQDVEFRNCKKARRSVKAMLNHATKAMDAVIEGLDVEQIKSCIRFVRCSDIIILPKSDPRTKKDYFVVPVETFKRLMTDVVSECAFCAKDGRELKKCARRRDLIDCGIAPKDVSKGCPYMEGVDW